MEKLRLFDSVLIHQEALESASAQRILSPAAAPFLKKRPVIMENDDFLKGRLSAANMEESKKTLCLRPFKGAFLKRCPGRGAGLLCCNYYVLNLGQHCEMDCSYCYLQSFITFKAVVIYTNIEGALRELSMLRDERGGGAAKSSSYLRIGTGEQADSLSLDGISRHGEALIGFFRGCPNWLLEFKTKSDCVEHIEGASHAGNVIVSWSLNPENIVEGEEHGTASLAARLKAAGRLKDKGFLLSFHIDPVVFHPDWRKSYARLAENITSLFKPSDVKHISLGALRIPPSQWAIMRERHGMGGAVLRGEFFKSSDGRLRYDSALRSEMFQFIRGQFKKRDRAWPVFLCMETPEVWAGSGAASPLNDPLLRRDFRAVKGLSLRKGACLKSKAAALRPSSIE